MQRQELLSLILMKGLMDWGKNLYHEPISLILEGVYKLTCFAHFPQVNFVWIILMFC